MAPHKDPRRRYPLYLNILVIFLLLMVAVAGGITWYNYRAGSERAIASSKQLMHDIVNQFTGELSQFMGKAYAFLLIAAEHPGVNLPPAREAHDLRGLFLKALQTNPHFFSVYLGHDNGDFFQLLRLENMPPRAREEIKAPPQAAYGMRAIGRDTDGRRVQTWVFIDAKHQRLSGWSQTNPAYDPRKRPWFEQARTVGKVQGSGYYVFSSLQEPGMTLAYRFAPEPRGGVLGVDVSARSLGAFVAEHKPSASGLTVVFDEKKRLVAYPDTHKAVRQVRVDGREKLRLATLDNLGDPLLNQLSSRFDPQRPDQVLDFSVGDEQYSCGVVRIRDFHGRFAYVALFTPMDELIGPIIKSNLHSLLISLLIMLAAVPLAVWVAQHISRPLSRVVAETRAMRELQLEPTPAIDSRVREIHRLTQSVDAMKATLRTFSRYVPVDLVHQLVASGQEQGLGGEKRVLTLMFSDVASFTDMAEHMDPEALMQKTSHYFSGLCEEILANQGTIDKFIGDAVMAFWNAPLADPEHAAHACRAALMCRARSRSMDQAWRTQGQPIMHTRLGLHTGEVIVGNVGTAHRMEYTALGAAVNLASRLEGLNKVYGTQILASQATLRAAGEGFVWRAVDQVEPKGTTEPILIHELVGLVGDDPELAPGRDVLDFCLRWEAAFALYGRRDWTAASAAFAALAAERPQDQVAQVLARRTARFLADPPSPDWDGSAVYNSK